MPRYSLFIDGHRTEAAAGRRYDSVDPYLGRPWASAADGDAADVDAAVTAARRALTGPGGKPNFLLYTRREPVGVVAAIVPWNSPLLLCWKSR